MVRINIIYDDVYDDVDIIEIPQNLLCRLDSIVRDFLEWKHKAPADDKDYWTVINGRTCSVLETEGFVKWLNITYCNGEDKAIIVKQHTDYCPTYESIEF